MVRFSFKKTLFVVLIFYISVSLWVFYVIFLGSTSTDESNIIHNLSNEKDRFQKKEKHFDRVIDIWGKAAIAEYLWAHVFEGKLSPVPGFLLHEGNMKIESTRLSYTTGPSLIVETADKRVQDLIIVLNGREPTKVRSAKTWIDALVDKDIFYKLKNLGIVILGNELCENDWLWEYVDKFPNLLKFVVIVYDFTSDGSRSVYQWPLGVATYRNFPLIAKSYVNINSKRKYMCNFLGTIYANSSRETLMNVLKDGGYNCFVKARYTWWTKETEESRSLYHEVLQNSDLTLSPVGINSESYRIYEALSYGSVPVLENVMTPGKCGKGINDGRAPYVLLKEYNAPVIFVKNWKYDLPDLLEKEKSLTHREIIKRRRRVLDWYEIFRYRMREKLLKITLSHFS